VLYNTKADGILSAHSLRTGCHARDDVRTAAD